MADESADLNPGRDAYRALLDASKAFISQPSIEAGLLSLRSVLSSIVVFDSVSLFLLDQEQKQVRLIAFDRTAESPNLSIGTEFPVEGTSIGEAIRRQKAIFNSSARDAFLKIPELKDLDSGKVAQLYVFPVSTPRRRMGAMVFGLRAEQAFDAYAKETMSAIAAHVAITVESFFALEEATRYRTELAVERDRLQLLLEINNHTVSQLGASELFEAASISLRRHITNDYIGFWRFDADLSTITLVYSEHAKRNTAPFDEAPAVLSSEDIRKINVRKPKVISLPEFDALPPTISARMNRDRIASLVLVPLISARGLIGILGIGDDAPRSFSDEDLAVLTQVGGQISLALENSITYGQLKTYKDRLQEECLYLQEEICVENNYEDIIGGSKSLRKVLEQVETVARTDSTVLLHGETGAGKELIARAIHMRSARRDRTFVRLNCAAIPSGLIESELFGHEKGAFTGALAQKRGRFELADRGTLFLDEIGDFSLDLQPKLLRVLQEHEFERLGGTKTLSADVRVIAATHCDLANMIRKNLFREDLYYRLNVFPIEIPPLRDRREDIPLLVHYFVTRLARKMQKTIRVIPHRTMDALVAAPWPGNIRELENFVERSVILSTGEVLNAPVSELKRSVSMVTEDASSFQDAERRAILSALKKADGRVSGPGGAAEILGLKRTTLQNKMKKLDLAANSIAEQNGGGEKRAGSR